MTDDSQTTSLQRPVKHNIFMSWSIPVICFIGINTWPIYHDYSSRLLLIIIQKSLTKLSMIPSVYPIVNFKIKINK